jgi:hypothetical protein
MHLYGAAGGLDWEIAVSGTLEAFFKLVKRKTRP